MDNISLVKSITQAFCENRTDDQVLADSFAPTFEYWSNGKHGDLAAYKASLDLLMKDYDSFALPNWDELFAADDKVVASYTLNGKRKNGRGESMVVMCVWRIKDSKVASLRQVFGALHV